MSNTRLAHQGRHADSRAEASHGGRVGRERRRGFPLLLVAAVCGATACAATAHPLRAPRALSTARVEYVPLVGALTEAFRLASVDGSARNVLWGPLRVTLQGGHDVQFASPFTVDDLVAAVQLDHAWLFVDGGGQILAGNTFLGELRVAGVLPAGWELPADAAESNGRLVLWRSRGEVLSTDGTGPLVPMRGVPAGGVRWVVFTNALRGVLAGWDGRVSVTHDGGESFRPLDLGADGLVGDLIRARDGTIFTRTSTGVRSISASDAVQPALESEALPPGESVVDPDAREAIVAAWTAQVPRTLIGLPQLSTGERWMLHHGVMDRFDALGRRVSTHSVTPAVAACELESWGASMVARCGGNDGDRLFALQPDGTLGAEQPIDWDVLSDDGQHAAFGGPCTGGDRDVHSICVRTGDGRVRDLPLPESARHISARGGILVVRSVDHDDRDGAGGSVFRIDVERRTSAEVPLQAPDGIGRLRVYAAHFTPGGAVVVVARPRTDPAHAVTCAAVGDSVGPLTLRPLPNGATWADFIDAHRGFAVGTDTHAMFQTRDGGATWTPLRLSQPGGEAYPLGYAITGGQWTAMLRCESEGCLVGRSFWLPANVATASTTLAVTSVARVHELPSAPDSATTDDDWGPIDGPVDLHCAAAPIRAGSSVPRRDLAGDAEAYGATGSVRWSVRLVGQGPGAVLRLKWEGLDERGAFRGAASGPVIGPGGAGDSFRVLGGDRDHALVESCASRHGACALLLASQRGVIRAAIAADEWAALRGATPSSAIVRSLHDAVAFEFSTDRNGVALVVGLLLGADGRVIARHATPLRSLNVGIMHGLAVRGDSLGLVVLARDRANALVFHPFATASGGSASPGETDAVVSLLHASVLAPCVTDSGSWMFWTRARMPGVTWGAMHLDGSVSQVRVQSDGAACLASVTALRAPGNRRDWTLLEVRATSAGMRASEPGGAQNAECTVHGVP